MAMVLPWARRRLQLQIERETEEQLASVPGQLLQVGQILGRLEAVTSHLEAVSADVIKKIEQARGNGDSGGNHAGQER